MLTIQSQLKHNKSKVELELKEKEQVVNDEEIILLFKARCKDLGFSINLDQLERFKRYILRNSYNGSLKLINLGLSEHTAKSLNDIIHYNSKIK